MSRAMLVTSLYRLSGSPAVSYTNSFSDVPASAWYADGVAWASKNGIVTGVGGGKFNPNGNVTREQIATFFIPLRRVPWLQHQQACRPFPLSRLRQCFQLRQRCYVLGRRYGNSERHNHKRHHHSGAQISCHPRPSCVVFAAFWKSGTPQFTLLNQRIVIPPISPMSRP